MAIHGAIFRVGESGVGIGRNSSALGRYSQFGRLKKRLEKRRAQEAIDVLTGCKCEWSWKSVILAAVDSGLIRWKYLFRTQNVGTRGCVGGCSGSSRLRWKPTGKTVVLSGSRRTSGR
jgi:hypothetical protein